MRKYLRFRKSSERIISNTGFHIITSDGKRIVTSDAVTGPILKFNSKYLSVEED